MVKFKSLQALERYLGAVTSHDGSVVIRTTKSYVVVAKTEKAPAGKVLQYHFEGKWRKVK